MTFCSTKGVRGVGFEEAVFSGYANDGGMFLPETIPVLSSSELERLFSLSSSTQFYSTLCKEILSLFVSEDEIPTVDLHKIVDDSFSCFPPEVLPMVHSW